MESWPKVLRETDFDGEADDVVDRSRRASTRLGTVIEQSPNSHLLARWSALILVR